MRISLHCPHDSLPSGSEASLGRPRGRVKPTFRQASGPVTVLALSRNAARSRTVGVDIDVNVNLNATMDLDARVIFVATIPSRSSTLRRWILRIGIL